MSIARQATNPESALCRFLDARLPQRRLIVDDWARQTDSEPNRRRQQRLGAAFDALNAAARTPGG